MCVGRSHFVGVRGSHLVGKTIARVFLPQLAIGRPLQPFLDSVDGVLMAVVGGVGRRANSRRFGWEKQIGEGGRLR